MSNYPEELDNDQSIIRVDDNITEYGAQAINQLRDAVFAIQRALGINPQGSVSDVFSRLTVSFNDNGTIKASAFASVGLATLPITNSQVGSNAGIEESKLDLDYSTSSLNTLIQANSTLVTSISNATNALISNFNLHLGGATYLTDASTSARHVMSHIDVNVPTTDPRDLTFTYTGYKDKNGTVRFGTNLAQLFGSLNDDLTSHENAVADAHLASAIAVNTDGFQEIPPSLDTAQKIFDYLDQAEVLNIGNHRATQHAGGVPRIARTSALNLPDGYGINLVPVTSCTAYLVHSPSTTPVDSTTNGDDIVSFMPTNTGFVFDAQFSQVRVGDLIVINYGNGTEASYPIESIRYTPGSEWVVRLNGTNLCDSSTATARIDRASYDRNTSGVLAVAAANAIPTNSFTGVLSSVIVGNPRGASALGLGFDPGQLDETHYNLYLELYPTGNPADKIIALPGIDVTGNLGLTPGKYSLTTVVQSINDNFRKIGYNYRFIAYAFEGEIGIMLADVAENAGFAIISGTNSSGTLVTGIYTNNVIGGNSVDDFDALGFGTLGSDEASPNYQSSFSDATAAQIPTKVKLPVKNRSYVVNGQRRDGFAPTYLANSDGYWDGYISNKVLVGTSTVETSYTVSLDLRPAELAPGKTIVIQPELAFSDPRYLDVDYGRFIIKSVAFTGACGDSLPNTLITVINSIHGTGVGFGSSSGPTIPVRLYFGEDSVGFNVQNVADSSVGSPAYRRFHEIYVSQEGKTFSHERTRIPNQGGNATDLDTTSLHVRSVSAKMRGYRDSSPTDFRRFLRLTMTAYDAATGEFDGYVGKRASSSSSGVLLAGPSTHGKLGVVTRFYDETNIDYVDLLLTSAITANTYVDFEVFPTLMLDDEIDLLATCEVNWSHQLGQPVVQNVIDLRNFGSIAEDDFTDSAIQFISAGDRLLHENGVCRGFEFDQIGTDNREIFFKGGVALVNGRNISSNNQSVTLPRVYPDGSTLPQTMMYAVCVNERGNLESVVITSTKTNFTATNGVSSYYLPSYTFSDLVNLRKDLTPISVVTATVGSFVVAASGVQDVRRLVGNQGLSQALVLSQPGFSGNFHSFASLIGWIKNYGSSGVKRVVVKGDFTIDTTVDFSILTTPLILEGDGGTITVTAPQGLKLGSNVTLRGLNFVYRPTGSGYGLGETGINLVNAGNGCIYVGMTNIEQYSNIAVKECNFAGPGNYRPPFVAVDMNNAAILTNFSVTDCTFTETLGSGICAAIAITTRNDNINTVAATCKNVFISRNTCDYRQGIYVATKSTSVSGKATYPGYGLYCTNVQITENTAFIIGYSICSRLTLFSDTALNNLSIRNNSSIAIGHTNIEGIWTTEKLNTDFSAECAFGTGNVTIESNDVKTIMSYCQNYSENKSNVVIRGNNLQRSTLTGTDLALSSASIGAIVTTRPSVTAYTLGSNHKIIDNTIDSITLSGTPYEYRYGILAAGESDVKGNSIRGLAAGATGILGTLLATEEAHVIGNKIYRGANSISKYISMGTVGKGAVMDNFFDSSTVDGSNATLTRVSSDMFLDRNINEQYTVNIYPTIGNFSVQGFYKAPQNFSGVSVYFPSPTNNLNTLDATQYPQFIDGGTNSTGFTMEWNCGLDLIPRGAKVKTVLALVTQVGPKPNLTSEATLILSKIGSGTALTSTVADLTVLNTNTAIGLTINAPDNSYVVDGATFATMKILLRSSTSEAASIIVAFSPLTIIYTY